jgi:TonB-linked SusC/RagA family outer membrane protein
MKLIKLTIILFILSTVTVLGQKSIKGKVTDSKGIPIPLVNVIIKGTAEGTVTNMDGLYKLDNLKPANILVFSFIGYQNKEVKVLDSEVINVTLVDDATQLDEIVLIGYDAVKKKDLTGSVSKIKVEDIARTATVNFDQALAGRAAGVKVTSNDGTPGNALDIVIRGGNSITGSNAPLYVVDGIPFENFDPASINTNDIKNFDILKDASATAIYGSRGANGVIIINTKGGRTDGKFEVRFSSSMGAQYIPFRLKVMGPYDYVKYQETLAYANDSFVPGTNVAGFIRNWGDPENYRNIKGIDRQDQIFRTAIIRDNNIAISGGSKKGSFYYSGGYIDQEGTLITTGFKKFTNRLKFTSEVNDNLKFNGQLTYSKGIQDGLQVAGNRATSVIKDAVSFRPINPITVDVDEEEEDFQFQDQYLFDPEKSLNNTVRTNKNDEFATTLGLNYSFMKKFTLTVNGNYWTKFNKTTLFYKRGTQEADRTNRGINGIVTNGQFNTLSTSNTLKFKDVKGKHKYDALVGFEAQSRNSTASRLQNTNLPSDEFGIDNLGIGIGATIATTSYTENSIFSYFGRLNYEFKNRYLATVNFRSDASSKFREENRVGYFPSFSLAWRVSQEEFIKSIDAVSEFKFRAGWGRTGNDRIGDYDAYNLYSLDASSGYVLGENQSFYPGAYQTNLAVPDLRWETTDQTNIGLDFGLFKRIDLTVDFYFKRTHDLLLDAETAPSTGFDKVQQNVGEVTNQGLEFTLNTINIKSENFQWDTNFNITFNKTNTVKLNNGQVEILTDPEWDTQFMQNEYQYVTRVNNPVGMIYGLEFDGIYQLDDFVLANGGISTLKPGVPSYRTQMKPGMVKFKDQLTLDTNGDGIADAADGIINELDRKIIGNPQPKHTGGLINNFKYKSFDLQILLQWAYDFDILNGNDAQFGTIYNQTRNGFTSLRDIWTPTNTDTEIGGMRYDGINTTASFGYKLDSRFVDDGSYLKLKSIVLGYNLPKSLLKYLKLTNFRASIAAQNLYRWTNYKGYDPDVSVGRFGALTPGLDFSAYPQSATITGGLAITF